MRELICELYRKLGLFIIHRYGLANQNLSSIFFPPEGAKHKEDAAEKDTPEASLSKKTVPTGQKIRSMLDVTDEPPAKSIVDEPPVKSKEAAEISSNPSEIAGKLPDPPQDEPSPAKKAKTSEAAALDEDWVEIDKESIPKRVTVEDVEDEEDKPKF
jgi:hypothetical protein